MSKINLGVVFGGTSTEHDVSIVSGTSIIRNLDKAKYNIYPIYISKEGEWFEYINDNKIYKVGDEINTGKKIDDIWQFLKKQDVVFPVLHGLGGEDGTIQGMLELLKIPYVGSKVLGSSLCMDKAYTKIVFEKAKIKQTEYVLIKKFEDNFFFTDKDLTEEQMDIFEVTQAINERLKFPLFVKPSNSGSSVGITKVNKSDELKDAIEFAGRFDNKILIEEGINAREIESALIGNEDPQVSILGEIIPADDFYSFDAKYNNVESKVIIPAQIPEELSDKIKLIAKKAFKATDCRGFARIDFFIDKNTNEIFLNEINTIPGFTEISMFPKLWEASGVNYTDLLNKLIYLAMS